jgi:hypothetical protein
MSDSSERESQQDEFVGSSPGQWKEMNSSPDELFPDGGSSDTESQQTVHVVAANYADDPHPHVEGVYSERRPAELCGRDLASPTPTTWWVYEETIQHE